ncbi:ras-like protein RAS2 [Thalassophryne amazonica]|uniref:ras-like protein RAS2 n=1 Tax=Thalassophryne amazonica TaxID=390379 RepID=UPI0014710C93|nr:ras-like protein RAS2 [Thalassophryne amazonica]
MKTSRMFGINREASQAAFYQTATDRKTQHQSLLPPLSAHSTQVEALRVKLVHTELQDRQKKAFFGRKTRKTEVRVYAVDDPESLEAVKTPREELLEVKEDKCPAIVVGANKTVLRHELQVSSSDIMSTVERDWNHSYLEASAKEKTNVLVVFRELLEQANLPSQLSPTLWQRWETFPKSSTNRPPMNKTNSCLIC